jgi:hypothetical protein
VKKAYLVVLMLLKGNTSLASTYIGTAENEESVIQKAIGGITPKLLDGFSIGAKSVEELSPYYAPANSGFDCYLPTSNEGIIEGVYFNLTTSEHSEEFKQDLQKFLSKYFPKLPTVFPTSP